MNKQVRRFVFLTSIATGILFFQNCSKMAFQNGVGGSDSLSSASTGSGSTSGTGSTQSTAPTCTTTTVNTSNDVKILFLVDTSGSNAASNNSAGTDNGKVWRTKTINDFVNAYSSNSNFYFGLVTFQGSSATPQISSGGKGIFTNNASAIQEGITNFENTPDQGSTPYHAALMEAKSMIAADLAANPSSTTAYVIVMISDGEPTDQEYLNAQNGIANLDSDVISVVDAAPAQVVMNTVYLYNPSDASQSNTTYLQAIASTANGVFVQASSQDTLDLDSTVALPTESCQ